MITKAKRRAFSREELKILSLSSLGGMLEFYDFIIFVFFASYISVLFFPPNLDPFWAILNTYGTFAAGYFARPLGGIIMAHFGDKKGRKNMFMLSIVLMVLPTVALGLMPTFELIGYAAPIFLILVRITQGIAIGGELPGAWVFISEHAPKNKLYFNIGVLTSAVAGGILIGSLVTLWIKSSFSDEEITLWAWRVPFLLGGVFGLISIYLRRYLSETPIFKAMQENNELERLPLKKVFKHHKINCIIAGLISWVLTGGVVVLLLLMPNFMPLFFEQNEVEISRTTTIYMQMLANFAMCLACWVLGFLSDKLGVARAIILFSFAFISCVLIYFLSLIYTSSFALILIFYILAAFFAAVGTCGAPILMSAIFENKIRFSAISFSYNIAYAIAGGVTPPFAVAMVHKFSPLYLGFYMVFLGLVALFCAIFFAKFRKDVNLS